MKILLAALLSVAFFQLTPTKDTPINNLTSSTKVQAVQVEAPRKEPTVEPVAIPADQEKTLTEPQAVEIVPEPVAIPEISHPIGCENYRQLISQYDWNHEVILQIAHAESGCNPSAVGDDRVIGGVYAPSCGLMQVRTLSSRPPCNELKDPATNIAWAYRIYQGQGYRAWSVCQSKVNCL